MKRKILNQKTKILDTLLKVRDFVEGDPRYNPVPEQRKQHQYCIGEALHAVWDFGGIPSNGQHAPDSTRDDCLANKCALAVANNEFQRERFMDMMRGKMDKRNVLRLLDRTIDLVASVGVKEEQEKLAA